MANTYLQRTESAGNRKIFTWSAWVKRSGFVAQNLPLASCTYSSSDENYIAFDSSDRLFWGGTASAMGTLKLNRKFRDTNAWYHIVVSVNTTLSSGGDRIKIYVNGVRETSFASSTDPTQDVSVYWNVGGTYYPRIGANSDTSVCFNGSMSHIHGIDGTAYDASAFGETDSTTGQWKIKTDVSVTYGTNGYFILKDGNSVTDQSGQGNNWTVSGGTLTKTEDNPSNVFCTFMSHTTSSLLTLSNGGTTVTTNSSSNSGDSLASLGASSGKFYWEVEIDSKVGGVPYWGVVYTDNAKFGLQNLAGGPGSPWGAVFALGAGGAYYNGTGNAGNIATGAWTDGDICGMAYDFDNGAMYCYKNGVAVGGGDPTSGASRTNAITTWTPNGVELVPITEAYNGSIAKFNFGNGYFGTTAVASAGTNASGNGIFEYDVPTGYTALSTKGLNL